MLLFSWCASLHLAIVAPDSSLPNHQFYTYKLHLRLNIRQQRLQFIHISLLLRPANPHPFLCIWLRNLITSHQAHSHSSVDWLSNVPYGNEHDQPPGAQSVHCSAARCSSLLLSLWLISLLRAVFLVNPIPIPSPLSHPFPIIPIFSSFLLLFFDSSARDGEVV